MDAAVGGTSIPLLDFSMMPRPISPSPLWFPALQDEYFAESSASSVPVDSSPGSSLGASGSWVAAPLPTKDGLSPSLLPSAGALAAHEASMVEIVGLPFERPDHEDDDPSGLLLLERCTSHDTMTTATTAATLSTAHTVEGAGNAPSPPPPARAHSLDPSSSVHEAVQPCHHHHRRKSSRASRRALSARDWDSILPHVRVKSSGVYNGEVEGYAEGRGR